MRVVRLYQSCSSPPSPPPPSPPPPLPPLPCSLPPCQLFANFRTLVGTAGPQLQGSELSEHRWTSTWEPPSSVSTAGPQRPDRMPEDMPDRTPDRMSERMPEGMPDKVPECLPDRMPEYLPDRMPDRMSEDMPDRMPEDLPVTKRINVMVRITRSKVIFRHSSEEDPAGGLMIFLGRLNRLHRLAFPGVTSHKTGPQPLVGSSASHGPAMWFSISQRSTNYGFGLVTWRMIYYVYGSLII